MLGVQIGGRSDVFRTSAYATEHDTYTFDVAEFRTPKGEQEFCSGDSPREEAVVESGVRQMLRDARRTLRKAQARTRGLLGDRDYQRHALVGPGKFWREKRAWQIAFLRERAGLLPRHRFLDIGCGTLRGGIPIIEYLDHAHYLGIEARSNVLDEARQELARHPPAAAKEPTLILSNGFASLPDVAPIDRAWGFSVLKHMNDPTADDCLRYVAKVLAPDGLFIANVKLGSRADAAARLPVVTRPFEFYTSIAETSGLTVEDLGTLASLGHEFGLPGDSNHVLQFAPS